MTRSTREDEIRTIYQQYTGFFEVARGSVIVTILLVIGAYVFIDQVTDYSMNVLTEAIGVIGTAFILDRLYARRNMHDYRREMIFQLGSKEASITRESARLLRFRGWLLDGSLHNAQLGGANLAEADLSKANLWGAKLWGATLERANLWGANLQDAKLWGANLTGAYLRHVDFTGASMRDVNLRNSDLTHAIFVDCDLRGATLPDGTYWSASTDLERFTNPEHPDYWQAE